MFEVVLQKLQSLFDGVKINSVQATHLRNKRTGTKQSKCALAVSPGSHLIAFL